ncbi:Roundabout-like 3 [Manis pentadactyla]|nr:Roundabout-like 3 [Manis pentadactyla]
MLGAGPECQKQNQKTLPGRGGIFWAAGVKIRDSKEKSWVKKRKEWDHSPREAVELASSPGEGNQLPVFSDVA